jgi:hypothetical protein
MGDVLTIEQIEATYDGEWVVLTDVEADHGPVLRRARVYWHGADHEEAWRRAAELAPPVNIAVLYVGEWSVEDGPIPVL